MKWYTAQLGQVLDITSSKRIYLNEYTSDGIPFFRSKEIIERFHGREITTELFISFSHYEEIKNKFGVPRAGDILLTSVGTIGIPYQIKKEDNFYFKDGNLTWFRSFEDRIYPDYVFWWLRSPVGQQRIKQTSIGSSQSALTIAGLKKVDIDFPSFHIQQHIVSILSAYDDLIENNLRRIQLLEEAARCEYKIMMEESTKWEKVPIRKALEYYIGGGWGEQDYSADFTKPAFVIRGTDIPENRKGNIVSVPFRYHKESNFMSRKLNAGDVVFEVSGGSKTSPVGRSLIISENLLKQYNADLICASFCKLLRPNNKITSEYLYSFLVESFINGALKPYERPSASNIINFAFETYLQEETIPIPPENISRHFADKSKGYFNLIANLGAQNGYLRQARDILLPKLMNGEIDA